RASSTHRVNFLGHVVSGAGVETDPKKTEAVRDWPVPRNAKMVHSFVGLASYYRRFIRGFADVAAPLHNLTRPGVTFRWSDEAERAFKELKSRLCNAPVLAYPNMSESFIVDTDASDRGLERACQQVQDGSERVIAYYSRRLDKAERNYCVTRRELLAVVESLNLPSPPSSSTPQCEYSHANPSYGSLSEYCAFLPSKLKGDR
uniref:Reverse transcriptase/retrotransposon-derived protein RNase H-like domain-containing protein n=1 Tax=Astyanax mexicanus TaxID=7994 RepID=A0A3B1IWX9_ASTMX